MTFEQFIASSVAIGPVLLEMAERGFKAGKGELKLHELGVGRRIKLAIEATSRWQRNENTNLGVVMLLMPLTAAAGVTLAKHGRVEIEWLREDLRRVLRSTTPQDALDVYDAILIARPGGLGEVKELDVRDESSKQRIKREGIPLYRIMELSSGWDTISREWVTGMEITFTFGYPLVKKFFKLTGEMNPTTVQTFLEILARYPDSFVQRIHGAGVAEEVSRRAEEVLKRGGMLTPEGRRMVAELDEELRARGINPGTTADLTASSLMLAILDGLRP